ncbi:MAG: hypothetical protein JNJ54_06610 [Myxococcaceae bacterium]|nr:hypothetical protein [Myxococcaceae bacterium]
MDPFVRRLVERLFEPASGMSRNKHFHTFDNAEGRQALRISKRLRALANDIAACHAAGGRASASKVAQRGGKVRIQLEAVHLKAKRETLLDDAEFELLLALPDVRRALSDER